MSLRSKVTTNTALKTMVFYKIQRGLSGIDWLNQLCLISFGKSLKVMDISVKNLKLIQKYYRCGQSLIQLSLPSIGWPQTNTHQWATQLRRVTCFVINTNMGTVVYFGSVAHCPAAVNSAEKPGRKRGFIPVLSNVWENTTVPSIKSWKMC